MRSIRKRLSSGHAATNDKILLKITWVVFETRVTNGAVLQSSKNADDFISNPSDGHKHDPGKQRPNVRHNVKQASYTRVLERGIISRYTESDHCSSRFS